jgi:hypothetical protein
MFSAGDTGSVDAYLVLAFYSSSVLHGLFALSLHLIPDPAPNTRLNDRHTAAAVYKPSYRPMPIALGLIISLRLSF